MTFISTEKSDFDLRQMIAPLARELSGTPDLARVELLGGQKRTIRIVADAKKLKANGVSLDTVAETLKLNHALFPAGKNWSQENVYDVEVGGKLSTLVPLRRPSSGISR